MTVRRCEVVLSLFPNATGFAYVAFESVLLPIDWGISDCRGKLRDKRALRLIRKIFGSLSPDILVLRDVAGTQQVDNRRLIRLLKGIEQIAEANSIPVVKISRRQVREAFSFVGPPTRYAIAGAIGNGIELFQNLVPPPRKFWQPENRRMGLFDAAAQGMTFFAKAERRGDHAEFGNLLKKGL